MSHIGWFITLRQIQYGIDIGTVNSGGVCEVVCPHMINKYVNTLQHIVFCEYLIFSWHSPSPSSKTCNFPVNCSWVTKQPFEKKLPLKNKINLILYFFFPMWKCYLSSNEQIQLNPWAASRSNSKGKCLRAWCYPVLSFRPEGNVFKPVLSEG